MNITSHELLKNFAPRFSELFPCKTRGIVYIQHKKVEKLTKADLSR